MEAAHAWRRTAAADLLHASEFDRWLADHGDSAAGVWLRFAKQGAPETTVAGPVADMSSRLQNGDMDLAGDIVILTGPPGSGKSTTSRALASRPGSPKVHLHADDFWHFIKSGAIPPYLSRAHDQNRVVMGVLAKAADTYAAGGYLVIVDGIIGPWFLSAFQKLHRPVHYVVLRPPLDLAIQRCRDRAGETLSDAGVITSLHEQFSDLGSLEAHVVITEGRGPDQTLGDVAGALLDGRHLLRP